MQLTIAIVLPGCSVFIDADRSKRMPAMFFYILSVWSGIIICISFSVCSAIIYDRCVMNDRRIIR